MLSSLFGDLGLGKRRGSDPDWEDTRGDHDAPSGFAATAILESMDTSVNDRGQMVDRHIQDLLITGSPAQGMRRHFANRGGEEGSSHAITLFDPMKVWAPAVVKALSDASGQPVERLHLRQQSTLHTLAMIERTRVVRRFDDTLKIYHADVRVQEPGTAEIPYVLMERAQLAAVIVGPMHADAVEEVLQHLLKAVREPTWRCPTLLFMLPPSDVWIARRIAGFDWPSTLRISVLHDSLSSTSAVWNALLNAWNRAKSPPAWNQQPAPDAQQYPIRVADLNPDTVLMPPRDDAEATAASSGGTASTRAAAGGPEPSIPGLFATRSVASGVDPLHASTTLRELLAHPGVLGCGIAELATGTAVAIEQRDALSSDLEPAASACAQVLRSQRLASRSMGLGDPIDEVIIGAGARQQVLRPLARQPGFFLFALIDRGQTNLAVVRFRIREIERALG